jgi:hypothetical protein
VENPLLKNKQKNMKKTLMLLAVASLVIFSCGKKVEEEVVVDEVEVLVEDESEMVEELELETDESEEVSE